jgi:hypothetical protein
MGVTWLGWYIPEDEAFVVAAGTLEWLVNALAPFARPISKVDTTLDGRGHIVSLYLTRASAEQAHIRLFGDAERMPVSLCVVQYPTPEPWEDDCAQRFCGSCGALVHTWAVCQSCGVEEDPQQWRLGPPLTLFKHSVGLAVRLEGGPDLVTLPRPDLDHRLRSFLDGHVDALEAHIGCRLKLIPVVVP